MISVRAAGGVLYRGGQGQLELAMIYRNGVWDLPKGKKEPHETVEVCAVREAGEELGITPPQIESFICTTYHEYERNGEQHGKTTHWFRMQAPPINHFQPQLKEGITKAVWMDIQEAMQKIGYENLEKVLNALA